MGDDPAVAQCTALVQCLNMCGGDMACAQQCQQNATPEANNRLQAVFACAQANQCVNQADGSINQMCLEQNCAPELGACFGGGGGMMGGRPEPMGYGTCDEFWECLNRCPAAPGGGVDEACLNQCIANSSQEGFDQALAVSQCVGSSGCPDGDGANCNLAAADYTEVDLSYVFLGVDFIARAMTALHPPTGAGASASASLFASSPSSESELELPSSSASPSSPSRSSGSSA